MQVFTYWDEVALNLERGSPFIAKEFREVNEQARSAAFGCAYLLNGAKEGYLDYRDSIHPIEYFEDATFFTSSDSFIQVLPWLISANREPVKLNTVQAATWHEAVIAIKLEMTRRALIAGHEVFRKVLSYYESSDFQSPNGYPEDFDMPAAVTTILEYESFDLREVLSRLDIEAAMGWRNWIVDGRHFTAAENLSSLTDTERKVYDYIAENPGKIGKEISKALGIPQSTLTRHEFRKLRSFGLRNKPGRGYVIEGSAEPR